MAVFLCPSYSLDAFAIVSSAPVSHDRIDPQQLGNDVPSASRVVVRREPRVKESVLNASL